MTIPVELAVLEGKAGEYRWAPLLYIGGDMRPNSAYSRRLGPESPAQDPAMSEG